MPRSSKSGTTGLNKAHDPKCRARGKPGRLTACACAWYVKYQGKKVNLARWSGQSVDPHELGPARKVLARVIAAIDGKAFDPAGEHKTRTSGETLINYIDNWWTDYVTPQGLSTDSLRPMCDVIKAGLGRTALHDLTTDQIETWLADQRRARKWGKKSYNEYRGLLQRLLDRAVTRRQIKWNPVRAIERLKGVNQHRGELRHFRLDENIEDQLFAVVDQLDRTQSPNRRSKLTQVRADAIRTRAASGTPQKVLASEYRVSPAVVSAIVGGTIWNPARRRTTTKGKEMRRRLIAAIDMGPRAGEMQKIQMRHVDWAHPKKLVDPTTGKPFNGYEIALPPEITKGGKSSGETEYLYAATPRAARMLEARRFQLKDQPLGFIFGTELGHSVKSFKKSWRALFALAGLDWGRAKGLTWHTGRHEFVSRIAETASPSDAQAAARHKQFATTQRYMHTRRERRWDVALGLSR